MKTTAVHVTSEATAKTSGIGAVLEGLITSGSYQKDIHRSILISPLYSVEGDITNRLGPNGKVLYSSLDGYSNTHYLAALRRIENLYNVNIIYGTRKLTDPLTGGSSDCEVLQIDISRIETSPVNKFKERLFQEFGIRSNYYEHEWEYEQYVRLAVPAIAAIKALRCCENDCRTVIFAHEYMGMPAALAGALDETFNFKTVFYAHEVSAIRNIVEQHPGHDTMFYNVLSQAAKNGVSINEVFGDQSAHFRYALVEASRYCDTILAVGDKVIDELKFMAPEFNICDINLAYNGIPSYDISLAEKQESKQKLRQYSRNLLGFEPDHIFTHVTRMVPCKGLWRDLLVLEQLDKEFTETGKTGVMFLLSTEAGTRSRNDILKMEEKYGWPVAHREGWPDLVGGEAEFYTAVQQFNARSRNIKVVHINQFEFAAGWCGTRLPAETSFMDLRKASDVEFGQSVYEPFGIAQLETLTFGGLSVISSVCGCIGFLDRLTNNSGIKNVIVADYTDLTDHEWGDIEDLMKIDARSREKIERRISEKTALEIAARLPRNDDEAYEMITQGCALAKQMNWDTVWENFVSKSIEKIFSEPGKIRICKSA